MGVELELAVVRGREYLARAVFRPDAAVSLGSNPRATVCLAETDLPEHDDLLRLTEAGARLRFERSTHVELQVGREVLDTRRLVAEGRAWETAEGWEVDLPSGTKGVVHFGALRVLLKLQEERDVTVWGSDSAVGAVCGGCAAPLPWAVAGPGALTPCRVCGDLNRVEARDPFFEGGATALVKSMRDEAEGPPTRRMAPDEAQAASQSIPPEPPPLYGPTRPMPVQAAAAVSRIDHSAEVSAPDSGQAKRGADLPTFDAIEAKRGADLPTFDAIEAKRGADLPTFDAIEARRGADLPTFDAIEAKRGADLPTFDAIEAKRGALLPPFADPDSEATVPPETPVPVVGVLSAGSPRGADLPTFDAISVIKRDKVLTTQAAMSVMKQEREPARSAAPNLATPIEPPPEPQLPPGLHLQPTGAVPITRDTAEIGVVRSKQPVRLGSEPTPVVVPREATLEARALLEAWEADRTPPDFDADPCEIAPTEVAFPNMAEAVQKISGASLKPVLSRDKKLPSEDDLLAGRLDPAGTTLPPQSEAPVGDGPLLGGPDVLPPGRDEDEASLAGTEEAPVPGPTRLVPVPAAAKKAAPAAMKAPASSAPEEVPALAAPKEAPAPAVTREASAPAVTKKAASPAAPKNAASSVVTKKSSSPARADTASDGPPSRDGLGLPPSTAGGPRREAPQERPVEPRPPDPDEGDYDDFLMGVDDGGIGSSDKAGWVLIGFGLLSGLLGMGLILYVFLQ